MTLFSGQVYGGVGQMGAHNKVAAAAPWYLAGGIAAANCIAAYQPKGAASAAAALVNLASPGTNDAYAGSAPAWNTDIGWTFGGTHHLLCGSLSLDHNTVTLIAMADQTDNARRTLFTCTTNNSLFPSFELNSDNLGKGMAIMQPGVWRVRNDNCHDNGKHVFGFTTNLYPTADKLYIDGTPITGAPAGTPSTLITGANSMAIGVRALPNFQSFYGVIVALALYSPRLSDAQVAAVSTAMAAL